MRLSSGAWRLALTALVATVISSAGVWACSPVARDDCYPPTTTAFNTPVVINVLANDYNPDGGTLVITSVTNGAHGWVSIKAGKQAVIYTPVQGFSGTDSFTYTIKNSVCRTATAKACVVVAPGVTGKAIDDCNPPATTAYAKPVLIDVLANDVAPSGTYLYIASVTQGSHGKVSISADKKSLVYCPNCGWCGNDTFTYTVKSANSGQTSGCGLIGPGIIYGCTTTCPTTWSATAKVCVVVTCPLGRLCGVVTCTDATGKSLIANVPVTLLDSSGAPAGTITTGADGKYCFENLKVGAYTVSVPTTFGGHAISGASSGQVTVNANCTATKNFAYKGGAISGYVYQDGSGNCAHDSKAINLSGITITLTSSNGLSMTTKTDANGFYMFQDCDLIAGTYNITAPGVIGTLTLSGTNPLIIGLTAGQCSTNNNFCYKQPPPSNGSISGHTYCQYGTAAKSDLPGVIVQLKLNGNVYDTKTTDGTGAYTFSNVPPGTYVIVAQNPGAGHKLTSSQTINVTLPSGGISTGNDFYYTGGAISGYVYKGKADCSDANRIGPVAGVTVKITGPAGYADQTTTAADGSFSFAGCALINGSYNLTIDNTDVTLKLLSSPGTVTINEGGVSTGNNFCLQVRGTIQGHIICTDDSGTSGISGVTVTLTDSSNALVGTATTPADGSFTFVDLAPGVYTLKAGSQSATVTVANNITYTQDFTSKGGSITGTIRADVSGDCSAATAKPLAGVTVTLTFPNGTTKTTTTAADGTYTFSGTYIVAGLYTVTVPGVYQWNSTDKTSLSVNFAGCEAVIGKDFCYTKPGCSKFLLIGVDHNILTNIAAKLVQNGYVQGTDFDVIYTPSGVYAPTAIADALDAKIAADGVPYCTVCYDTEFFGQSGAHTPPSDSDQQRLHDDMASGMGFVYAAPYNSASLFPYGPMNLGQLPKVLPVEVSDATDPTSTYSFQFAAGVPTSDPFRYSITAPSFTLPSAFNADIKPDCFNLGIPTAAENTTGVTYTLPDGTPGWQPITVSATSNPSLAGLPGMGGPTTVRFNYGQTGGRVAIIGTAPWNPYGTNNVDLDTVSQLYVNALKWTAGITN